MNNFIPGLIMGFREGLEAFLVISIMLRYIDKINKPLLKRYVYYGAFTGIIASIVLGGLLAFVSNEMSATSEVAKIWESVASIVALGLVTTFIIWMVNNGSNVTLEIEGKVDSNLSKWGIFSVATIMIAREGAEIAIFSFTGKYTLPSISVGIMIALVAALLIYFSLVKVNLKVLFSITLIYLILQAGFLLGYGIHEGLSALNALGKLSEDSILFTKAFNLSKTVLNHKEGVLGIPLYVLFGWYSKPEWIQFIAQYAYTIGIFALWLKKRRQTVIQK
jgi:high-affinity iron transporter